MVDTNAVSNNDGRKIYMYTANTSRGSLSTTQYLPLSKVRLGINQTTPVITDTELDEAIPISDGTANDDGSNQLTGSSGGDNSTDNSTTFKPGAGVSDDTAQNLIANDTNATKIWTISDLSSAGTNIDSSYFVGLWVYILDATALAKFVTTGAALEIKLGSDSSNYYSKTYTASQLSTGWQFLSMGLVSDLTETGTVGSPIDTFIIEITTNNTTDTFVAGDVVYDLLRTWQYSDTIKSYLTGFPSINLTNLEVTRSALITTTEANGFLIDGISYVNEDDTPLMGALGKITADSKSNTDQWRVTQRERIL
jgi:hypothetical protein